METENKSVPDIRVTVMASDLNPYGGAFGGWIISQMALGAASLASRHSKGRAILVAADEIRFPAGAILGDEVSVYTSMDKQGRTSMTISARADRRERNGEFTQTIATGRFIFVAVDDSNVSRQIDM